MRRFLRDTAVALFVGAVLVVLAMVLNAPSEDDASNVGRTPAGEAPEPQ